MGMMSPHALWFGRRSLVPGILLHTMIVPFLIMFLCRLALFSVAPNFYISASFSPLSSLFRRSPWGWRLVAGRCAPFPILLYVHSRRSPGARPLSGLCLRVCTSMVFVFFPRLMSLFFSPSLYLGYDVQRTRPPRAIRVAPHQRGW